MPDEADFFWVIGRPVRTEQVVEPYFGLFREGDGLPVFYWIPGVVALLFSVHQPVAEATDPVLFEERQDGEIIRAAAAGHPFRAEHRPVEAAGVPDKPTTFLDIFITMERDDVTVRAHEFRDGPVVRARIGRCPHRSGKGL